MSVRFVGQAQREAGINNKVGELVAELVAQVRFGRAKVHKGMSETVHAWTMKFDRQTKDCERFHADLTRSAHEVIERRD